MQSGEVQHVFMVEQNLLALTVDMRHSLIS